MPELQGIVTIFEEAIDRAMNPVAKANRHHILSKVEEILRRVERGELDRETAYYALIGIAWTYVVPLTPADIARIRELLGVEVPVTVVVRR